MSYHGPYFKPTHIVTKEQAQQAARNALNAFGVPELDHVVCCNPAKALCGAFVMGQDVKFGGPEQARNACQECWNRAADGEKCGAPDCPGGEE